MKNRNKQLFIKTNDDNPETFLEDKLKKYQLC